MDILAKPVFELRLNFIAGNGAESLPTQTVQPLARPLETWAQKMARLEAIRNEPEMRVKLAALWHKEQIWDDITTQKPLYDKATN